MTIVLLTLSFISYRYLPGNSEDGGIRDVTCGTSDNDSLGLRVGSRHGSSSNWENGLEGLE
jgi:hypothetical protein